MANERPVDLELDRNTVFVPSRLAAGTTGFTSFVDHNKRFKPKLVVNVPGDGGDMTGSAGVETSSVTAAAAALTRFTTNVSTSGVVSFSLEASVSVENHSDMAKDVSNAVMTSKSSAQQQQQPTRLACFYCGQFVQNSQQSGCDASGDVSVLSSNSWAGHATCREKILQKRGLKTFPPPPLKPTGNTATTTASSSNIISVIKQAGVTAVDSLSDDAMDVVIVDEDDIVGNGCGDSDYSDLDLIQLEDYGAIVSDPAVVLLSQTLRQVEPTTFTSIFAAELAGVMDLFAQRAKRTPRRSTPLFRPSVNNNTNTAVEASIVAAVSSSLQSSSSSATTTTSTTATVAADVGNNASTGEVGEKVSSGFEDNRNIMAIRMKYMQISPRTLITDPKYVQNDKYFFKNTTFEDVEYERLGVFVSLVLRIHIQKLVAERFSV